MPLFSACVSDSAECVAPCAENRAEERQFERRRRRAHRRRYHDFIMPALSSSKSSRISSGRKLGGSLRTNAAAVFAHNDRVLLAASGDEIKLFACKSARRIGSLQGHKGRVNRVVVSSMSQVGCFTELVSFLTIVCRRLVARRTAVSAFGSS